VCGAPTETVRAKAGSRFSQLTTIGDYQESAACLLFGLLGAEVFMRPSIARGVRNALREKGFAKATHFGSAVYSKKELTAEMGAAYLLRRSRNFERGQRESSRVCCWLAQETP
jgi:hypothetical protein